MESPHRFILKRYSERGLVNAWVQGIACSPDPVGTLMAFLDAAIGVSANPKRWDIQAARATVYIEHSLSDFGDPDLVVIVEDAAGQREAVFLEVKLTTFLRSGIPNGKPPADPLFYQANTSGVLHELYLKAALWYARPQHPTEMDCTFAAPVYSKDKTRHMRKIGNDKQVISLAAELCRCHQAYFTAITTDSRESIEAERTAIMTQMQRMAEANCDCAAWLSQRVVDDWRDRTHVLSWENIETIALSKRPYFDDLITTLDDNRSRLTR